MLFVFPMWDNESERGGFARCTPIGYALQEIARGLGVIGFVTLLGTLLYLLYRLFAGFTLSDLLTLLIPFGIGIVAQVLYMTGWGLAQKKDFDYDPEERIARWKENGEIRQYHWESTEGKAQREKGS
jgi:hypothetical protein